MSTHEVDVAIVGGGPAGMLLGLLLAKQGVRTLVLERHKDFGREYRGEVLMPRFTQIMRSLGLFDRICEGVHRELEALQIHWNAWRIARFRIGRVCPEVPFALWQPQPVLLSTLHGIACEYESFDQWFHADVRGLIEEGGEFVGLRVRRDGIDCEVRARVTVGADGRFSTLRRHGGFEVEYTEHKFDLLWFTIPEPDDTPAAFRLFLTARRAYLALPKHPSSIQCGMLLPKDGFADYRQRGIGAMREDLLAGPPLIHSFARELEDFEPFVLLQAKLDFVKQWTQDGLLLIGDAAHTCSPVGAIGVSVAVHTAAVAAEVIPRCLERNDVSAEALGEVQRRREVDVRSVHRSQGGIGGFVTSRSAWVRRLLAVGFFVGSRLGMTGPLTRLVALPEPFEPAPELVFDATPTPSPQIDRQG